MCDHQHSSGCCHGEDSEASMETGIEFSLYTKIDIDNLQCLNELVDNSGKSVFKSWENRLSKAESVESDMDEELLFNIPFTGYVKLKGLICIGGEDERHPSRIRIFKNRGNMNFDDVKGEADQEFELTRDNGETVVEYPLKIVKFSSVYNMSLHFPSNFGSESTRIYYIGLRGEFTPTHRDAILMATYESAPNPCDHNKIDDTKKMHFDIY